MDALVFRGDLLLARVVAAFELIEVGLILLRDLSSAIPGFLPQLFVQGLHAQVESGFFGLLLGAARSRRAEAAATRRARELLALMEVEHVADHLAVELSSGQQRMVELVRALATDPPLLLLDEPAVGLAPPMREKLGQIIRRLAKERGIGIVLIEHAIELVMTVSDRVVVLNYGRKVADAAPDEVRADKKVLEAYLGHA